MCIRDSVYIVDIQNKAGEGFEHRVQYYIHRIHGRKLVKDGKRIKFKDITVVVIANFNVFPNSKCEYSSFHNVEEEETRENNVNAVSYVFLDLTEFNLSIDELETPKQRWCYFFKQDTPCLLYTSRCV